jgi:gas vesicle protein
MNINRVISFISGLLSGALVGAAVVILITPQSGADTRQSIVDKAHEILDAGREAAEARRKQLRQEYETSIRIPLPLDQAAE